MQTFGSQGDSDVAMAIAPFVAKTDYKRASGMFAVADRVIWRLTTNMLVRLICRWNYRTSLDCCK